jgi:Tfp pilus assembly protein PilF/vacuolar-type H+-ATPase subunit H
MTNVPESSEPKFDETENIIREYVGKFNQAIEIERNKLRERAEHDSSQIIARAREEADKIINQARQEAEVESDKLITQIKEKEEQILRESREQAYTEARREFARIINEAREKTAQIIEEVVERGITQEKNNFIRTAVEAKSRLESEKSKLFTLTRSIEQIIDETETNIQEGVDHLATIIAETEEKMQAVNEIPRGETGMTSLKVAEEYRETEQTIEEEISAKAEEAGETEQREQPETKETEQTIGEEISAKTEEDGEIEESENAKILVQKGLSQLYRGKNEEALSTFSSVIGLDPKYALEWRREGTVNTEEDGETEQAIGEEISAKTEEDGEIEESENAKILVQKGLSQLYRGKNEEALSTFSSVIRLDPKYALGWRRKGTANTEEAGETEQTIGEEISAKAEEAGETEQREQPETQETEQTIGEEISAKTEEDGEIEKSQNAKILMQMGLGQLGRGKNEEALTTFSKVIRLDPKYVLAWRKKGETLGNMMRYDEALEAYNRSIELDPNDAVSWNYKALALKILGRKKEAKKAKDVEKQLMKSAKKSAKL